MAAFHEVRFPDRIARGAVFGPVFKTEIVASANGFEQRNQSWSKARAQGDIGTGIETAVDFQETLAFFYARKGRLHGFRFKDHADYSVTNQVLIASTVGGETSVQLLKTYTDSGGTYIRTIYKPVSGTVTVYDNASPIGGASVNTVTGVVTFSARASGHSITADFQFDVPVRFDNDDLRLQLEMFNAGGIPSIGIVELRLDSDGQG